MQCYGHDIGGFEGPQPSPELLLRWIQLGIHSPRFAINCFKTDENDNTIGGVIEPWMYPEVTPLIRDAIKRRYELIPYLYSLMLESHNTAVAPQRWIGWGYESDKEVWSDECMKGETQYWLGDTMMIGGVYEPGNVTARMYLPTQGEKDFGYFNLNAPYEHFPAGQWVNIDSQWKDSIPLLAKVGGGIAIGKDIQTRSPGDNRFPSKNAVEDDYRAVEIFPPRGNDNDSEQFTYSWYEDDGISRHPSITKYTIIYSTNQDKLTYSFLKEGSGYVAPWEEKGLHIILPMGENRQVLQSEVGFVNDHEGQQKPQASKTGASAKQEDSRGRSVWLVPAF
jgi:alpha-glucosidase (family GH31 glycosyl hydrolase)